VLETLVQGKIRLKLLTRLFLNPESRVYLRGLEKEFGVSSNTVRYELNKLSDLQLIEPTEAEDSHQKLYKANAQHPMFVSLRNFVLKQAGMDSLIEKVFQKLGQVESVYLTHDWAEGKESLFIDLVVVGEVDRNYMMELIDKVERLISRKIRVAVFGSEFTEATLGNIPRVQLI